MNAIKLLRNGWLAWFALGMAALPGVAHSACSESAIHRYHGQGKTLRVIADRCEMEIDEVKAVLADEEADADDSADTVRPATPRPQPRPRPGTYPPGAPVSQCGCWGAIWPGQQIPNNMCSSGTSVVVACQMQCPGNGGNMWYTICG